MFRNRPYLFSTITKTLKRLPIDSIEIVNGTAKGGDILGENYAKILCLPVKQFPPDWSNGKQAGYVRNKKMAAYGTHLIAFWDRECPGTKIMIELAKEFGLGVKVIRYV